MRVPKFKKLKFSKFKLTKRKVVLILLIAMVPVMAIIPSLFKDTEHSDHQTGTSAFNQQNDKRLVDTDEGAPQTGRDPSRQQQASLNDAASQPTASGKQTDKPAADVQGDHSQHATHDDVFNDPKETGIGVNGCYVDYGIQGQQCLPAHAAGDDKKLTCHEVHAHFPTGIKVTGKDRFQLDKNGDGTACNNGD